MAIQRQATDPGQSLQTAEAMRYSLSKKHASAKTHQSVRAEPKQTVGRDLLITIVVFGILLAVVFFLKPHLG